MLNILWTIGALLHPTLHAQCASRAGIFGTCSSGMVMPWSRRNLNQSTSFLHRNAYVRENYISSGLTGKFIIPLVGRCSSIFGAPWIASVEDIWELFGMSNIERVGKSRVELCSSTTPGTRPPSRELSQLTSQVRSCNVTIKEPAPAFE